jgi:hypothetical protein
MAAFADRSALLTFIAADTQRSDLTATLPVFLALVEGDLAAALKVRPMIERWTVTINDEFVSFPTDFAGARTLRLTGGTRRRVRYVSPDQMADLKASDSVAQSGEPQYFTILGDEFEFYPDPDGSYAASLTGYLGVTALSSDSSTNWLLAKHPAVYVAGLRKYIFRRSRNAVEIARADADFETQMALIYKNSLAESFADDFTPSAGMVV